MAEHISMQLRVGDYLSATCRLTTEQHGAYLLLLMDCWVNGPLPGDDAVLARVARLPTDRWRTEVKPALKGRFLTEGGQWVPRQVEGVA